MKQLIPAPAAAVLMAFGSAAAQEIEVFLDDKYVAYHVPGRMTLGAEDEYTAGVAFADFDGDGDPDLFAANGRHWPGRNELWFNNGAGRFPEAGEAGARKATAYGVCPRDYDNDGDVDVVIARDQLKPVLYLNDGKGNFPEQVEFGRSGPARDCAAADFDGDGAPDIAFTARGAKSYVVFGSLRMDRPPYDIVAGFSVGVTSADLDGDGQQDLLFTNRGGATLTFVRNKGGRTFEEGRPLSSLELQSRSARAVDVDGDSDLDIAVAIVDGANVVVMNDDGAFDRLVDIGPEDEESFSIAAADFNKDGRPDLLVGNIGDDAVVLNLPSGYKRVLIPGSRGNTYAVAVADVNGDGLPDFVLGNSLSPNLLFWTAEADE